MSGSLLAEDLDITFSNTNYCVPSVYAPIEDATKDKIYETLDQAMNKS